MTINEKYLQHCQTESDIFQLLPYLREYAAKCKHITELGTRTCVSAYAFLDTRPDKLICYDIARWEQVDEMEQLAKAEGVPLEFKLESSLECVLDETDMLFIDTFHSFNQLSRELERHHSKVKSFIALHDTQSFRFSSEPSYQGIDSSLCDNMGLWPAVEEFLRLHPEWVIDFETHINNGLTVLKRIA